MFRWLARRREYRALIEHDAADLIARFGDQAYSEASMRARLETETVDGTRPGGHWARVKCVIAEKIGKTIGLTGREAAE